MKTKQCMIYKDVVNKRLARKREQVSELETKNDFRRGTLRDRQAEDDRM